jgi:DNA repair photolyase
METGSLEDDFVVETRERKTAILKKGTFGCLKGILSINVTMGCLLGCVYCYARGYPGAPGDRKAILFENLPKKLKTELSRKREKVTHVLFNTASDCFQPHPDIMHTSVALMEILLSNSIPISFLTKGVIPRRFFDMVSHNNFSNLITARIGMVSLADKYHERFEPYTATPKDRLKNIEKLIDINIVPDIRIDPIIPFVTDSKEDFELLFKELKARGIQKAALSYLHLRPAIEKMFNQELDGLNLKLLEGIFTGSEWKTVGSSTRSKLVPKKIRERGYDRAREAAEKYGLKLSICSCKNPDIPGETCIERPIPAPAFYKEKENQLSFSF